MKLNGLIFACSYVDASSHWQPWHRQNQPWQRGEQGFNHGDYIECELDDENEYVTATCSSANGRSCTSGLDPDLYKLSESDYWKASHSIKCVADENVRITNECEKVKASDFG